MRKSLSGLFFLVASIGLVACAAQRIPNHDSDGGQANCPTVTAGEDFTVSVNDPDPTLGGNPTASGGTAPYTYTWTGDMTFLGSTSAANPTFDVAAAGPGDKTVCVTVNDGSACAPVSDCVTVTVTAIDVECPTATITATPSGTLCIGGEVVLDAGDHSTYLWSTGETTRTITITADDTYSVHVTDPGDCTATAQLTVGASAVPVQVDTREVGEWGMLPKLIPSPNGERIYLFFSSPDARVKTFDVASETWLEGALVAPQTGNTNVRWIGQDYAVDGAGNLHVVWGEGTPSCQEMETRVRHVAYDGAQWSQPETLAMRSPGDPVCGFQNVAMASDGAGRLLVTYQVPTMIDANPDNCIHPKKYRIHDGNSWSAEALVGGEWKGYLTAAGGAGAFYVSYMVAGGGVDTEISMIPSGSTAVAEVTRLTSPDCDLAANFFVEASGTTHAVWETGHNLNAPQWHASGIYYNHRAGGIWAEGNPGTQLVCASFFGDGSLDREEGAPVQLAVSSSGTKLVVFTYMARLYYLAEIGGAWGAIHEAEIDGEARQAYPIALGSTGRFLVVWSTGDFQASAALRYTILEP